MFFVPMWSAEEERIGFQRCTAAGYQLRGIAGLIGFFGLLSLFFVPICLASMWLMGRMADSRFWWLLALPLALGFLNELLMAIVNTVADGRGFSYDYERRVASWRENDRVACFSYEDWKAQNPTDSNSSESFNGEAE